MTDFGPDAPCQRAACADDEPHRGGEHLDPRSPRYDGPDISISALGHQQRRAARALIRAGASVADVMALVEEIHRLNRAVASVRVDMDRKVRDAMARADDCAEHGAQLVELGQQLYARDEDARRYDRARCELLALPFEIQQMRDDATVTGAQLKTAAKKVMSAHDRAMRR